MRRENLIVALLFLVPSWCLADAPLADRVPGDALVYFGWAGSQSLGPAYPSSHLKAMLDASALPELMDNLVPQLISKSVGRKAEDRAFWTAVSSIGRMLWQHPTAVYFGGCDWDTGGPPMPRVAVLCDGGADVDALLAAWNNVLQPVRRGGPPISANKYGTLVVAMIGTPAAMDKEFANPPANSLADALAFKSDSQQVQVDAVSVCYIDVAGVVALADDGVKRVGDLQAVTMWPKVRDARAQLSAASCWYLRSL